MTFRGSSASEPARRGRRLSLATVVLAGALAASVAAPASASAPAGAAAPVKIQACGWNKGENGERAYYEHCATNTNVWIQVTRWPRSNYHRCVGPGRTNLDFDATGAWYDSNYRGGLCSHPGDTGP
ncbi:hypothetical protein J1792_00535 [Streptomyces triculaminicus]|uniref:Secreted protein n=2 Tax=Streptomyces TaxID=1883 RepID=A0A939FHV1_9ACTN|nr:DUF6355 family natural product biosynthesis protein [Streptomyces triculaminicus]MBO0651339.1 hypothetical protein [Streptomyces triculaminicus]QSY49656.1 hypothetical protein J3S04_00530 [Streptomyces griseocarneus]